MYKLSDDVMIHTEDDKKFLVNTQTGKVFALNETAIIIIEELQQFKSLEEIKKNIQKRFIDIQKEQINSDVDSYVEFLISSKNISNL